MPAQATSAKLAAVLHYERRAVLFLVRHVAFGAIGALVLGAMMLAADIGGLRTLAFSHPDGWLYLAILFFGIFITCGGVAAAIAIMALGKGDPRA
jgi:TRAP-type C4-dicarboxylate transport system permease small subunit